MLIKLNFSSTVQQYEVALKFYLRSLNQAKYLMNMTVLAAIIESRRLYLGI